MADTSLAPVASGTDPRPDFRPLYAANLICTMSVTGFTAIIGPLATALDLLPWHAGLAITMAGLVWMLSSQAWGRLSDRAGRRFVLLIGLGGFAVSYFALCGFVAFAFGAALPPFWSAVGLVALRSAMGAFYAAIPAAGFAMIADSILPESRAGAMAGFGAAGAIGLVVGPAVAAGLAGFGLVVPLYVLAALPLAGIALVVGLLPATAAHVASRRATLRLTDPRIRPALLVAFAAMFCVGIAQITVGFLTQDRFGLPGEEAATVSGIAMTVVGVALIAAQALVARIGWPPRRLIPAGAAVAALGFGGVAVVSSTWLLWLCFFLAGAGMGLVFPAFSALAANAVGKDDQGSAAGSVGAAQGLGMVCGPLVGAGLYGLDDALPYLLCLAVLALVAVAFRPWTKIARASPENESGRI